MKSRLFTLLSVLLIINLFLSCSEDTKNEPLLEISKSNLLLPEVASSEVINIKTNQGQVTAETKEEWIKTETSKESITISVENNPMANERNGIVTVKAGSLKQEITVKQGASGLNIIALPKTFNVETKGGSFKFNVSINTEKYLIASSNDWIKLNLDPNDKSVVNFTVSENKDSEARVGKIKFLVSGRIEEEVTITQSGIGGFTLPYFTFGATAAIVKDFEKERNNPILRERDISGTGTQVAFKVEDKIFDEFVYLINLKGYVQSSMFVKGGVLETNDKEAFEKFLVDKEGFETKTEKGYDTTISFDKIDKTVFVNSEKQVKIEFMADKKHNHYRAVYYPKQTRDYATFSEFPYFESGITKDKVMEYESTHGGTLNNNMSKMNYGDTNAMKDKLFFDVKGDEVVGRTYYVYHEGQKKHGLTQITNYYADVNLAFYQGLDGDYYLTKEFLDLARENGFRYSGVSAKTGSSIFNNVDKGTHMSVRWEKNEDLDWVLRLAIY